MARLAIFLCSALCTQAVSAFTPAATSMGVLRHGSSVTAPRMSSEKPAKAATAAAVAAALAFTQDANALTNDQIQSLTYLQIKGTGQANRCPELNDNEGAIKIPSGKTYVLDELCIEPKIFQVEEEVAQKGKASKKAFVPAKVMTRETYTLTGIDGTLKAGEGGKLVFEEKDGIDYAPTTVQMPGGARVPFLFTVKNLKASTPVATSSVGSGTQFGGEFYVPSYRTGTFLDPKGRGQTSGYDQAQALPASQTGTDSQDALFKENNKVFDVLKGQLQMEVTNVNEATGEIAGVFVSQQPSDTDMGALEPKTLLLKGIFYGNIHD